MGRDGIQKEYLQKGFNYTSNALYPKLSWVVDTLVFTILYNTFYN